ncbi:NAD(P)-dependent oxidoreductase [Variovorax sp. J22R133]|uniref:NAD(P)-dependent oxidoreductase n=1 Tax=Variovorax brevis TaxID=3053503 RepID=UPI002574D67E|nr:NAD(P)-dependent oxidoreductase [Variovorax sp. J22R133]MDM0116262.1 NAD(P)-dependent oxidoreductase [Variovorax sp. J22R133]
MKIGFIGLGAMGAGIALNLLKAGHELVVYDVRKESAAAHIQAGARWSETVAELAREADVVFTSVPGPKEMRELGVGEGGLASSMRKGSVWFDLTTNSPTVVREVAARVKEMGIELLDAPVSGGPAGARSGKLAIYVGGDREVFDRTKVVLDAVGDKVMYVGAIGAGNVAKLVHNLVSLVMRMTIAEGMSLGTKAGMDPLELWHAVRQGVIGRTRTFDLIGDQYLQSKYDQTGFNLRLGYKDFTLALDLAKEMGVPMKQSQAAYEDYTEALERGWGDLDSRVPMQLQNERAGVTIKESAENVKKTFERG